MPVYKQTQLCYSIEVSQVPVNGFSNPGLDFGGF